MTPFPCSSFALHLRSMTPSSLSHEPRRWSFVHHSLRLRVGQRPARHSLLRRRIQRQERREVANATKRDPTSRYRLDDNVRDHHCRCSGCVAALKLMCMLNTLKRGFCGAVTHRAANASAIRARWPTINISIGSRSKSQGSVSDSTDASLSRNVRLEEPTCTAHCSKCICGSEF